VTIERILITGGSGFLGQALVRELEAGPIGSRLAELRLLDLAPAPLRAGLPIVPIVADVCDPGAVADACRGVDAVIHAASLVDWGEATVRRLEQVNVTGAENVVRACQEGGVPTLVYTSTMDVVCGTAPVVRADETTPYPTRFTNEYSRTKALAEQRVLAAHGSKRSPRDGESPEDCRLSTCALRPCGMYGEGDPYHVANVLRVVRAGRLPFRIGDSTAPFEHVYVGNVARAHLLALERLAEGDPTPGGQAYFVTDDTPAVGFLDFMEHILTPLGYELPPASRRIPYALAFAAGAAAEAAAFLCRPFFRFVPTLTRSSVRFVCHEHTFRGDKLRRDLGYAPAYEEATARQRTIAYFRALESEQTAT